MSSEKTPLFPSVSNRGGAFSLTKGCNEYCKSIGPVDKLNQQQGTSMCDLSNGVLPPGILRSLPFSGETSLEAPGVKRPEAPGVLPALDDRRLRLESTVYLPSFFLPFFLALTLTLC